MSIWLKNLIGIFLILHGLAYGIMLDPTSNTLGSGMGKFWSRRVGSKILSSINVSEYRIRVIAIIISFIILVCFIIAGSNILATGALNKFSFTLTLISASIAIIFMISYWHIYTISGFLVNIAILVIIPILYIKLR